MRQMLRQSVSVIVPAYNSEKTIESCIEALLLQDYQKELYEVIVVDDGSTDNTAQKIKKFPVKYIWQKNSGPASARNNGVTYANGDTILFTDSDCMPDVNWISEMVKPFKDINVMAVKGAYRNKQKSIVARFAQLEFEERFEMLKKAEYIDMVDTYSAGFRKDIFLKMGGFDTSFPVANNEDTELSYRMSRRGLKMVFNPEAIVYHLNHPDSIKRYARLKFWRGYWRIVVYKRFPDKMLKDTYTPQTLKLQTLALFGIIGSLPAAALSPAWGGYFSISAALFFLILSMPFMLLAFKKEPVIALFSPAFLLLRAASIGSGALWGALKGR